MPPVPHPDSGVVTVIEPDTAKFRLRLKETWQYRDLILLLVRRDFVAQYKQTLLGPAWHIIQPLLTTVMFTIVFGNIAKLSTDGVPPFLFYLSGIVVWSYFANVFTEIAATFSRNAHIFGKVYFPRLSIPISVLFSKLMALAIQLVIFIGFLVYYYVAGAAVSPNGWIWLTPVLFTMMAMLALGGGIIIASITARYRDLMVVITFGLQLLMYATPIIYPLSSLPERWQGIASLNPVAPIVETFRYAFLGQGTVSVAMLMISAVTILTLCVIGVMLFNRVERTFMDTV